MSKSEAVELTALCMVSRGNEILMQNRVKDDWRGFTLPGGHIEKGEPFCAGIIREMREETGLLIKEPRLCGVKQFENSIGERYIVLLYKTDKFSGELCSSDEGEMVWVDRADLPNIKTAGGFFDTLRIFDDERISELFYGQDKEGGWTADFY